MARTFTLNGRITRRSLKRAYSINLLTCVRVGVSPRHAYVSHHPQHENASELEKGSEHRVPTLRARHSSSQSRVDIAPRPPPHRGLFTFCVCVFNCE